MSPTALTVSLFENEYKSSMIVSEVKHHREHIPDTDKFDIHVDRVCSLECMTFNPALLVITAVHVVCERNLLMIIGRDDANFSNPTVKHT